MSSFDLLSNTRRSQESTGSDLVLEPLGDLVTNQFGDLELVYGEESITKSLLRRLRTPSNGYARWVNTSKGLVYINKDYASDIFLYLSYSLTSTTLRLIKEAVLKAALGEKRIKVQSVLVQKTDTNAVEVVFNYVIKGETELRKLVTDLKI